MVVTKGQIKETLSKIKENSVFINGGKYDESVWLKFNNDSIDFYTNDETAVRCNMRLFKLRHINDKFVAEFFTADRVSKDDFARVEASVVEFCDDKNATKALAQILSEKLFASNKPKLLSTQVYLINILAEDLLVYCKMNKVKTNASNIIVDVNDSDRLIACKYTRTISLIDKPSGLLKEIISLPVDESIMSAKYFIDPEIKNHVNELQESLSLSFSFFHGLSFDSIKHIIKGIHTNSGKVFIDTNYAKDGYMRSIQLEFINNFISVSIVDTKIKNSKNDNIRVLHICNVPHNRCDFHTTLINALNIGLNHIFDVDSHAFAYMCITRNILLELEKKIRYELFNVEFDKIKAVNYGGWERESTIYVNTVGELSIGIPNKATIILDKLGNLIAHDYNGNIHIMPNRNPLSSFNFNEVKIFLCGVLKSLYPKSSNYDFIQLYSYMSRLFETHKARSYNISEEERLSDCNVLYSIKGKKRFWYLGMDRDFIRISDTTATPEIIKYELGDFNELTVSTSYTKWVYLASYLKNPDYIPDEEEYTLDKIAVVELSEFCQDNDKLFYNNFYRYKKFFTRLKNQLKKLEDTSTDK